MRSTRPAAAATLPSLLSQHGSVQVAPVAAPSPYANGHANGYASGNRAATGGSEQANGRIHGHHHPPVAIGAPPPITADPNAMQTILPPRPTGRMPAAATGTASWWKSWPLIVIVLAGLAIVAAVVLMVWPPAKAAAEDEPTKANKLAPAPERMDTNPLPPNQPRSGDPWSKPDPANPANPTVPKKAPDIDIPDDPDPVDPDDPTTGQFGGLSGSGAIVMSMMRHACDRASSCGKLDDTLRDYCAMAKKVPATPPPSGCPAANRCLNHIDEMSCASGFDDISQLSSVMYKFQDCVEAIGC